jgi:hypothetical protein
MSGWKYGMKTGFIAYMLILQASTIAHAQTVIFDDTFDSGINSSLWNVVVPEPGIDSVSAVGGNLNVINSGAGSHWAGGAGLWSKPELFPLITRPTDDTEYNVYFEGISLPSQLQRFSVGLYSTNPPTQTTPKFPDDNGPNGGTSYYFSSLPNSETPTKNWLSTFNGHEGGAATDSTGGDGFHTWEYGKVYDLRLQVTKDDVNWWGRDRSLGQDWLLLQDPETSLLGHPGTEPSGRNKFGLFVSAAAGDPDATPASADADISIERIYVTRYRPVVLQTLIDQDFRTEAIDESVWSIVEPERGIDRVESKLNTPLRIVSSNEGSFWKGGAGIWTRPDRFPLFKRPTDPSQRVYVDFLGVSLPSLKQRCAFGLYSTTPQSDQALTFPGDRDAESGPAYFFWVLPDNDLLVENSNQLRAGVNNDKYAATDNFHHAWIWSYTEKRDLRLEVTKDEVRWFIRKHEGSAWRVVRDSTEHFYRRPTVPSDYATGYWRPLYDPGIRTGRIFDGTEENGRNLFGVFVHVSAAGSTTGGNQRESWNDGDVLMDGIKVTVVGNQDEVSLAPSSQK